MQTITSLLTEEAFKMHMTDKPEKALVVDDEATNRLILSALLSQLNFQVIEAHNGAQALELFATESPDIIFMDIMMPEMDGYEATSRIKTLCGDHFVPVIVLTAITDEDALAKCITAGGDDVLSKPFDATLLKSKIHSMMRIRNLHRRVNDMYTQIKYEETIAEKIFSRAVTSCNVTPDGLQILLRPASVFSGDMVLTEYGPGGDLHILLGDFTGHGLAAAIGALPAAEVFRAMVTKGFGGDSILSAINDKLHTMLPAEIFMAACYVHLPSDLSHAMVFNCGLPDVLVVDKHGSRIKNHLQSKYLPLGISSTFPPREVFERLELNLGDRLYLYSDGVIESRNPDDEEFGQPRLEQAITTSNITGSVYETIITAIDTFCQHAPQHDDITLVEIPFLNDLLNKGVYQTRFVEDELVQNTVTAVGEKADSFRFAMTMVGQRLRQCEPLPLIMNELHEMKLPKSVLSNSFTILTELLVNALDHGVLGLDSTMKCNAQGFTEYFNERERRLKALEYGSVDIEIWVHLNRDGGRLEITIEDSGPGFDYAACVNNLQQNNGFSGRGIALVRSLCHSLHYRAPGNKLQAIYAWTD